MWHTDRVSSSLKSAEVASSEAAKHVPFLASVNQTSAGKGTLRTWFGDALVSYVTAPIPARKDGQPPKATRFLDCILWHTSTWVVNMRRTARQEKPTTRDTRRTVHQQVLRCSQAVNGDVVVVEMRSDHV